MIGALLLLVAAGVACDIVTWRRIHPAYWWGAGTVALMEMLIVPIGISPPVVAFAARLAG